MLLSSVTKLTPSQMEALSLSSMNRLRNGNFQSSDHSFFPWVPSGFVQLQTGAGTAMIGRVHARFTPGTDQRGRLSQRTRMLRPGALYVLRFAIRSIGAEPQSFVIQFGDRSIKIDGASLPCDYGQFTLAFRAHCRYHRIRFTVNGADPRSIVDLNTVSLCLSDVQTI